MQMIQRSFLVVAAAFCFVCMIGLLAGEKEKTLQTAWEEQSTEQFINTIIQTQQCTYEEYIRYCDGMRVLNDHVLAELTEHQKERDRTGKVYWYLISWEEILDILQREGVYYFQSESALEVRIWLEDRETVRQYEKYGIIAGKGNKDDTKMVRGFI